MDVIFRVQRQSAASTPNADSNADSNATSGTPDVSPTRSPQWQTYHLDVDPSTTILDGLNQIKWEQDGTLAFRRNCRNTICGSCTMTINGRSALACKENIGSEWAKLTAAGGQSDQPTMTIAPLGNLPVIRDLVVDMQPFWQSLKTIDPYINTASRQIPEREFLQTPAERSQLDQTGNCIMCGACYGACNSVTVNPEFVGPHALAKAYRMVADNRDDATTTRLEDYNNSNGVWGCTRCNQCNSVCPMDVAPLEQISKIKREILDRADRNSSRAIRHRQQMVSLVKQGGWIDERKFGLNVVGNGGKDVGGLASLVPLGWRMLRRGKFPIDFHPSDGQAEVAGLIDAVQAFEAKSKTAPDAVITE
jgi:succinate dehydrogenase / fumarate reductase, iron-sulfur subunit